MKKTWIRLVSLLIVTLLLMTGIAMADTAGTAQVVFSVAETEDDIVKLDVSVKNATFRIIQMAIRYDKNVVVPINEDGSQASVFDDFVNRKEEATFFSEAGTILDAEKGLFGFTFFVAPGTRAEGLNDNGEYMSNDGVGLASFRFKRISQGNPKFEIAFEDESKPYQPSLKEGIIVLGGSKQLETEVSFTYEDKEPETIVVTPIEKPEVEKEPEFTSSDRKKDVICLQIGKAISVSLGKKTVIDPDNNKVVPYISNDRTMVPIRFVAESLGAEVLWEEGWSYCIIKKDSKEIKLNFNSTEFEVDGKPVTFDTPIELTQDRTMVPIRFVSEQLGCDVHWNEKNRAVIISPEDNPWDAERDAEITALNEMLVTISGMLP